MNSGLIDNFSDTCVNCEEANELQNLLTAELQFGTEMGWGTSFTKYQVSGDRVKMKICLNCIRKKRRNQWTIYSILALIAVTLIFIDFLDSKISILGAFGIFELGVLLIVLPKMTYRNSDFCDEVAQKHFMKNAPEELRKNKKFRVFTRSEIKKMMKLS